MAGIAHLVAFRFRPKSPTAHVDLRGDMVHWGAPTRMQPAASGAYQAAMRLPVGTYEYKFRLPREDWHLDPDNPRTRNQDGHQNNLLVVGGTDEPVLHAPCRPWLFRGARGQWVIRAGLRRSAGDALTLCAGHGATQRLIPMFRVADEEEHRLFEATLAGEERWLEYYFVPPNGRGVGTSSGVSGGACQAFRIPASMRSSKLPSWWQDAVVYSIFVDRFRRGGHGGQWSDASAFEREHRAGGDLAGIEEALPYLSDLGVTALHITPVIPSPSVHRYDAVQPRRVAEELGGPAAFERLLSAARDAGLRVLCDIPATHVSDTFPPFQDVREHGRRSRYWDWFHISQHPFREGPRPGYLHYQKGQWREPLLNTDNPEVQEYLTETFAHWVRAGADGVRVDAAADLPTSLLSRLSKAVHQENPAAVVVGEVVPAENYRFLSAGLDATTDFGFQRALLSWLAGDSKATATVRAWEQRRVARGGDAASAMAFVGNHDQSRVATQLSNRQAVRLAHVLTLTAESVPALYYGDEVGLSSQSAERAFEDAWPDRQCMPWNPADWDTETHACVKAAILLRRSSTVFTAGDLTFLSAEELEPGDNASVLGFLREHNGERAWVFANGGQTPCRVRLPEGALQTLTTGHVASDEGWLCLGPFAAAVFRRSPAADTSLRAQNRVLGRLAFQKRSVLCPAYPANLYVTVTEACNLRCQHCITSAPGKTRSGEARTLTPWLIDRLRPAFAHADYIAFVHGGESLVAPVFFEVLSVIRDVNADRTTKPDIHLVSNGMRLTRPTLARLLEYGVTSLMVSLDGASPQTNDSIRLGADLSQILGNIRHAVVVRDGGANLRIGISTVVGQTNVSELPAMARLAIDIGVDWLKIEETAPTNPFAMRDSIEPEEARVREAMDHVRRTIEPEEVVLVDHLAPPKGCACAADPSSPLAAFRRADEFANRAEFNPCREAWEQAAIDPDGTVRLGSYDGAALGSVACEEFLDLWNGASAQEVRSSALARLAESCLGRP